MIAGTMTGLTEMLVYAKQQPVMSGYYKQLAAGSGYWSAFKLRDLEFFKKKIIHQVSFGKSRVSILPKQHIKRKTLRNAL